MSNKNMGYRYACLSRQRREHGAYHIAPVSPGEIEAIRSWRNAQIDVLRQSHPLSEEEQRDYYCTVVWPSMEELKPGLILFSLFHDEYLIGYGGLVHLSWEHRRAEVSFLAAPEVAANAEQYEQAFSAFLILLRQAAFDDIGLNRLHTETYAFRDGQLHLLERAGFRREGVLREHVFVGGLPVDSVVHGALRSD